jgi:hypothetical protein
LSAASDPSSPATTLLADLQIEHEVILEISLPTDVLVAPYEPRCVHLSGPFLTDEPCEGYLDHHYSGRLTNDLLAALLDETGSVFTREGGGMLIGDDADLAPGLWPSYVFENDFTQTYRLYVCPLPLGHTLLSPTPTEAQWQELVKALLDRHAPTWQVAADGSVSERPEPQAALAGPPNQGMMLP